MIDLFGLQFTPVELVITCGVVLAVLLALVILAKMPKKDANAQEQPYKNMPQAAAAAPSGDEELVAVLAAAVAASTGMAADTFRIESYRQVDVARARSAWSRAGRREQMNRPF